VGCMLQYRIHDYIGAGTGRNDESYSEPHNSKLKRQSFSPHYITCYAYFLLWTHSSACCIMHSRGSITTKWLSSQWQNSLSKFETTIYLIDSRLIFSRPRSGGNSNCKVFYTQQGRAVARGGSRGFGRTPLVA